MMLRVLLSGLLLAVAATSHTVPMGPPMWETQASGVTTRLRGVSAVSDKAAWASGANGTVLRTIDAGRTWQKVSIPGTETLDFRDVEAINERVAYVLSIGSGEASRIFKTEDGGAHWNLQFMNRNPRAFFNAIAFWDGEHGIAASDSVDGHFVIVTTADGGGHWTAVPEASLPPALSGEGGFAASGTNITVFGTKHAWIGTGAAGTARVLRTADMGRTWAVAATPLRSGPSSGVFSIAFRDALHGIVVGGDYRKEQEAIDNLAVTSDGGATWTAITASALSGFRSVVAFDRGDPARSAIAVGPSGADWSEDAGAHWTRIECAGFHAFSYARRGTTGWAVGENGRISRLTRRLERPKVGANK